jgi:hypothetical protein
MTLARRDGGQRRNHVVNDRQKKCRRNSNGRQMSHRSPTHLAGGDIVEDEVVSADGSYQATAPQSSSGGWVMQMVTFY